MPPCSCIALPTTSHGGCRRRATWPSRPRCRRPAVARRRRSTASSTSRRATVDRHQHVGAGVLDRLEGADRAAELVAHLRVGDGRGQHRLGQARGCRTRSRPRPGRSSAAAAVGVAVEAAAPPPTGTVGGHRGQPAGFVEYRLRRHRRVRRRTPTTSGSPSGRRPPAAARRRCRVGDELGAAAHRVPSKRTVPSSVGRQRHRRADRAGRHSVSRSSRVVAGLQRLQCADSQHRTAEVGCRRCRAAHLLADRRPPRRSVAPAPPSSLGHLQPDPARRRRAAGQSTCGPWPADRLPPNAVRRGTRSIFGAIRADARFSRQPEAPLGDDGALDLARRRPEWSTPRTR